MQIPNANNSTVTASIRMPREVRLGLETVRLARAQRGHGLPPRLRDLVIEALRNLIAQENAR